MDNIVLIGLMNSGKTTLGKAVAARLGMDFFDTDHYIEDQVGLSVFDQFQHHGESFFRDRETEVAEFAASRKNSVIATGGGIILRPKNMAALGAAGRIIFIDRPLSKLLSDLDTSYRPLLKGGAEAVKSIHRARMNLYRKYADATLLNDGPLEDVVAELAELIHTLQNPKFAIIGDPLPQCLASDIHLAALRHYVPNPTSERIRIERGDLPAWLDRVRRENYQGFEIKTPHKLEIASYLDELSIEADLTGSVNTVVNQRGRLIGHSTDALGFFLALGQKGIAPLDKRVLILGAGGFAGSLALHAIQEGADRVEILARRPEQAHQIATAIRSQNRNAPISWGDMSLRALQNSAPRTDILIDTTPLGMEGVDAQWTDMSFLSALPKSAVVCDLICTPPKTAFLEQAEALGLTTQNGIDTLIYQSLISDHLFLNRDMDYTAMAEVIRETLLQKGAAAQ